MRNEVNEMIAYGISGLLIGMFVGWIVSILNNISGIDATFIMIGCSATLSILFAFFPKIIASIAQLLMSGDGNADIDFEIEIEPETETNISETNLLPNKKANPWVNPHPLRKRD